MVKKKQNAHEKRVRYIPESKKSFKIRKVILKTTNRVTRVGCTYPFTDEEKIWINIGLCVLFI